MHYPQTLVVTIVDHEQYAQKYLQSLSLSLSARVWFKVGRSNIIFTHSVKYSKYKKGNTSFNLANDHGISWIINVMHLKKVIMHIQLVVLTE